MRSYQQDKPKYKNLNLKYKKQKSYKRKYSKRIK